MFNIKTFYYIKVYRIAFAFTTFESFTFCMFTITSNLLIRRRTIDQFSGSVKTLEVLKRFGTSFFTHSYSTFISVLLQLTT